MNTKLKVAMIRKGARNFDVALHLKCDPAKISKIVNGWITPDEKTKNRISKYLRIPVSELFD